MMDGVRRRTGWFGAGLLVAAFALLGGPPPARAAVTGVVYNPGTGHWYKYVSPAGGSWSAAKAGAEALGGYLVAVNSDAERLWIDSNLRPSGATLWLGGTDANSEGTWTWVSGEAWSYTYWNGGEPNNSGNEDYLMVNSNGTWNDITDNYGSIPGYVVEWNADPNAPPPPVIPADPSDLAATLNASGTVTLVWTDNSGNESKFEVERKVGTGSFARIAIVSPNVVTFEDETLDPLTDYSYRVRAANTAGTSGYTNEATVTTGPWAPSPTAPADLEIVSVAADEVVLGWTDASTGELGFNLYRRLGDGEFDFIERTDPDEVTGSFPGLAPDTLYGFEVRAVGSYRVSSGVAVEATTLGTLAVTTHSADLKDVATFAKDTVKASFSWEFAEGSPDGDADPVSEGFTVRLGVEASPANLSVPADDPGWKGKGAKWKWKSPAGSARKFKVQVDLDARTLAVSGTGLEWSTAPANPLRVSLIVGDDAGSDRREWPATSKAGVFKYRE